MKFFTAFYLFCFSLLFSKTPAQTLTENVFRKNTFFAEAGGKGPVYSLNYERIIRQRSKVMYGMSMGFSLLPDEFSIPLGLSLIPGKNNHHTEFSLGITPAVQHYRTFLKENDNSDKVLYVVPGFGYRYQRPDGGITFRGGVAPFIFIDPPSYDPWDISARYYFSGYLSLGWNF